MGTEYKLITNSENNHLNIINEGFSSADQIIICVAFLKKSGLALIQESLFTAIENETPVKVVAGLDFFLTEPDALRELFEACKSRKNASLLLCAQGKDTFHPKLYYWTRENLAQLIIGSANLTAGGLSDNFEISVFHTLQIESPLVRQFLAFISSLEKSDRVSEASDLMLSQYQRRYDVYNAKRKKAEKEANKELKEIFAFDQKKLKRYLAEYRNNEDEQANLRGRRAHYRAAKELLETLATKRVNSKAEFLKIYEQLVGAKDASALWHSGYLYRAKNTIAPRYVQFLKMLKALRKNINSSPDIVLDVGRQHAQKINGVGLNVITEIMNTYAPKRFSVLNNNPVGSLKHLGFERFGSLSKSVFTGARYVKFNDLIQELANSCEFRSLSEVDHFLNYVYFKHAKPSSK